MDRIDPIIKVFAEPPLPHQRFQVHVGGADEPDVHRDGLRTANAHDAPVLDRPQQFRLQVQRNVADFIQEERPAVGLLELAHVVRMGIRESALDVTEQFTLEPRFGNGAGIHRHHRLSAPEAPGVDLPRQNVLAGSVFAGDEHRGIRRGNLVDGLADGRHGLGGAPEHGFLRSARNDSLPPHRLAGLVPRGGEGSDQFLVLPGFHDEIEGAALHSFHGEGDVGIGREQDHFHFRRHLLDLPRPVEAFVARIDGRVEVHVQQDDVRPEPIQGRDQRRRRRDGLHLREVQREQDFQRLADAGVVVHDEYLSFLRCHNRVPIYAFFSRCHDFCSICTKDNNYYLCVVSCSV